MSPTERSIRLLKDHGFLVGKAEHWNPFAKRRVDLFGFCDLVAVRAYGFPSAGIVGVQATAKSCISARRKKISDLPAAVAWLAGGGKVVLMGWDGRSVKMQIAFLQAGAVQFRDMPSISELILPT